MTPTLNVRRVAPGGRSGRHLSRLLRVAACVVAAGASAGVGAYTSAESLPRATRATVLDGVKANELGERAGKAGVAAALPVLAFNVLKGTGGVPTDGVVAIEIDWDSTETNGGRADEGRIDWLITVDGATPSVRISRTSVTDGSTTVYMDTDTHTSVMTYVTQEAGEHKFYARYRNAYGLRCEWTLAATIDVHARAGSDCYVDGAAADDTGDGLTPATAKQTMTAGINVLKTLGDDATLHVKNCNNTSTATFSGAIGSNLLIRKADGEASATITITTSQVVATCQSVVDGLVFKGLDFEGADDQGTVVSVSTTHTATGIAFLDCNPGNIRNFFAVQTGGAIVGLGIIRGTQTGVITHQGVFSGNARCCLAWGIDWEYGSEDEHTFRYSGGGAVSTAIGHGFAHCRIGVQGDKSPIRWYATAALRVHDCDLLGTIYHGFTSPGDTAMTGGSNYVYENCHFRIHLGQTTGQDVRVYSGWSEGSIRDNFFDGMGLSFNNRNDETSDHYITNTTILNNTITGRNIFYFSGLTNAPINQKIINNLFIEGGMASTRPFLEMDNISVTTGWEIRGNRFNRTGDSDRILYDAASATYYAWAAFTALSIESDSTRAATTIDGTTAEPSDGLTAGVVAFPMPHVSYNGVRYDKDAATYPVGAWLDPAEEETPYDIFTTAGTYAFIAPVTGLLSVQATGGSGSGGSKAGGVSTAEGAGGGGGGEYAFGQLAVTLDTSYTVVVGARGAQVVGSNDGNAGGDSYVVGDDSAEVRAKGGGGGGTDGTGGVGGTGGTGDTLHAGGSGGEGNIAGGGGGAAGSPSGPGQDGYPGNHATYPRRGGTGVDGAGSGGDGANSSSGFAGTDPGGGGGGGRGTTSSAGSGAAGRQGQIILSWTETEPDPGTELLEARDAGGNPYTPAGLTGATVHLGDVTVGETAKRQLRLFNLGDTTITYYEDSQSVTGDAELDATWITLPSVEIEPGASDLLHRVTLTETATIGDGYSFTLSVPYDGANTPFEITCTYNVVDYELTLRDDAGTDFSPIALDGETVTLGSFVKDSDGTRVFRITNTGDSTITLDIDTLAVTGDATDADPGSGTVALASGEYHEVTLDFDTSATGTGLTADMTVDHDATGSPFNITFTFDVEEEEPEPEPGDDGTSRVFRLGRHGRQTRV